MSTRPRKSSARVTLVLLGAAALAACGQQDEAMRRDVYANKDDCIKDWGDDLQCDPQVASAPTAGGPHLFWLGPAYGPGYWRPRPGPAGDAVGDARPGSRAIGSSAVSRGGFGGSGAAHSSGGS
jgi:uncharacterized protein YgiB involved in biofilm formation